MHFSIVKGTGGVGVKAKTYLVGRTLKSRKIKRERQEKGKPEKLLLSGKKQRNLGA